MYDKKMYQETFSMLEASENTLFEVLKMTKENKKPLRITRTALIAAIVVLMLGMATVAMAYSGAGNWFLGFFRERSGEELTVEQQQLIEDETVKIGSSITSGDITITVESALSDDYNAFILLKIEAPEGFDLGGKNFSFWSSNIDIDFRQMSGTHPVFEDENGKPNILTMLMNESVIPLPDSGFSFRDGSVRRLTLTDICNWTSDGHKITLVEGTWSFDIVFSDVDRDDSIIGSVELVKEPVYCYGSGLMGDSQKVLMTSFELRTFGAIMTYEQSPDERPEAIDFIGVQIIMKDGSAVELSPSDGQVGIFTFRLATPIILGDVDYVQFPEGILLPMPIS